MNKWFGCLLVILFLVSASCTQQPTPSPAATPKITTPSTQTPATQQTPATTPKETPKATATAPAGGEAYYRGKTIDVLAATAAGGGTDATARIVAAFMPRYIPGNPKIIVRNQPGAGGVVPANSFFEKAKPDGLNWLHGSSSVIANQQRKVATVRYDMRKAPAIGNIGEAGTLVGIRKDALKRLTDSGASPVVVGTRSGESTWDIIPIYGKEFLGWNVRWIPGFGGTGEIDLAARRGEVDMFGDSANVKRLIEEGIMEPVAQVGLYNNGKFARRADLPKVPTFVEALGDKKPTGIAWDGYMAVFAPQAVFKFTISAPGTPDNIMKILTDAYSRMSQDPQFNDMLKKSFADSWDISVGKDTERLIRESLDVSEEAVLYVENLSRKLGIMK